MEGWWDAVRACGGDPAHIGVARVLLHPRPAIGGGWVGVVITGNGSGGGVVAGREMEGGGGKEWRWCWW